jgi:HSP20 family protein
MTTDYLTELANEDWFSTTEGQLSVDVMETPDEIIVRSAIAGVPADDLDISVTADTLTIRGKRDHGCIESQDQTVHVRECYWGSFSRSVVLPCHIRPEEADATLKNGILTVTLKKVEMNSKVSVIELDA